ncbi:MAG: hypothetical protein ACYTGU_19025 [Planctomycetota bacterium]
MLLALAVGFGAPADAGPTAGKLAGLYLAYYPNPAPGEGNSQVIKPRVQVGSVLFTPVDGKMVIKILLNDGQPNKEFRAFVVPLADWSGASGVETTDGGGKAEWSFDPDIPADAKGNVLIKAIVRPVVDGRYGPVYATERVRISLKK